MSIWIMPVALALVGASLSSVQRQAVESGGQQTVEDEADSIFRRYVDHLYDRQFDKALALTDELRLDPGNRRGAAIIKGLRAAALLGLKRESEAKRMIAEAERLSPEEPFPTTIVLEASLIAGRLDFAADAIDRLIARFPDVMRNQDPELIGYFLRNAPKEQEQRNQDRKVALARLGYGGDTNGDWLAAEAIKILVSRGDLTGAADFVTYIDEPQIVEDLLVQRRFSKLWPKLEERAGTRLSKVRASSAASAERDYLAASEDHEKLQIYINALRRAGRFNDAIALRSKLPATQDAMEKADEQLGWAVNNMALALHDAGRAEEADSMFAMLNEARMDNARWRVSMIINRLELLVSGGKFENAASLLEKAELSAKNDGNDFARQLVRRLKYCTLSSLGRQAEAARVLQDLMTHAPDAPQPTIEGLLCAGEIDKAEELTLKALHDPKITPAQRQEVEEDFIRAMQPIPLTGDDPSVWANKMATLRQRPAIASAYARLGRDMPAEYRAGGERD